MSVVLSRIERLPKLSRLGWLMGLYAENHRKLERLFSPANLVEGQYHCAPVQRLPLRLEIVCQHRFTTELGLSYEMRGAPSDIPDPTAHIRFYHDARQAEATHFHASPRWQDVLGLAPSPQVMLDHRLKMNTFLSKWLDYLQEQGYGMALLERR
ncbi:hypothetical protein CO614_01130 [Lysobacteraceae bacterium NML120232]|nr:hypothetical protein CO608_08730 [Xanthomonadaceae bacterium NML08-0793]PJK13509.1 hypothetical protein CO614_01130 [Xanthomonadaceae bacterium NML120232]